jgi:DNA mismatch repair protein MutL
MSLIHVLDESTINQIAAGEVVERPSAVVKELIENAMDAGATAVTAEIKEGGLTFIRITDNGSGIAKEDIALAFLRHATSKIRIAEDLLSVTSLGFRGEALSSIAAVAQVELITKTPTALNGYRYVIEGGEEKSLEEIGSPSGTTIIIRNIFYNTPARRKFLKSAMTEAGYISDLMERLIVSHPEVAFKFIMNNQVKLQSSGNNNTKDILYHIYGRDISKELLPVEYSAEGVAVTGFIGKPIINRGNRNFENYFINGRYIKSNIITKAIEEAYKPFMMQHKYPFTSIYFEIEPSMIDVNVHPQKMEIRLKNGEEIYQLTYNVIRNTLAGKEMIPKVHLAGQEEDKSKSEQTRKEQAPAIPEPFEQNRRRQLEYKSGNEPYHKVAEKSLDYIKATEPLINSSSPLAEVLTGSDQSISEAVRASLSAGFVPDKNTEIPVRDNTENGYVSEKADNSDASVKEGTSDQPDVTYYTDKTINRMNSEQRIISSEQMKLFSEGSEDHSPFLSKKALEEHRIIGQLFQTYWLVEYKKELYIIDQHAAHEKVLYERIMTASKSKTYESQQLLPPIVLSLTLKEQEVLLKHEPVLNSLGYEFEQFGGNEYSVRAVPADLYSLSEKELLLEFIDTLADDSAVGSLSSNSILERVASLSCKAAVKANHTLSYEEASSLIRELLTLENPYHCPHGRPVIISMSQYELERKFKRIL